MRAKSLIIHLSQVAWTLGMCVHSMEIHLFQLFASAQQSSSAFAIADGTGIATMHHVGLYTAKREPRAANYTN